MQFAMVILAGLAVVGGVLQIPWVTHVVENFLHPTFEDSRFAETDVSGGLEALALVVGGVTALAGIGLAWLLYARRGLDGPSSRAGSPACTASSSTSGTSTSCTTA